MTELPCGPGVGLRFRNQSERVAPARLGEASHTVVSPGKGPATGFQLYFQVAQGVEDHNVQSAGNEHLPPDV